MNFKVSRATRLVLAGAVPAGLIVGLAFLADDQRPGSETSTSPAPVREPEPSADHPLDPIPGFGKGEAARTRDDAIALWEAFLRERSMMRCMAGSGFEYYIDLRSDRFSLLGAGKYLDADVNLDKVPDGERSNDRFTSGLDHDEKNRYYRTLFGVSWDDISNERGDIQKTGCFADAMSEVGSLWAVKDAYTGDLLELVSRANDSAEVDAAEDGFESCASELGVSARNQADLESSGLAPATIDKVLGDCGEAYDAVRAAKLAELEAEFLSTHPDLQDQASKYAEVKAAMLSERGFLTAIGAA